MNLWLVAIMLVIAEIKLWLALVVIVSGLVTPTRYRWIGWSLLFIMVGVWVFSNEPLEFGSHITVANWITFLVYVCGMGLGIALGCLIRAWLRKRLGLANVVRKQQRPI
jgi:Na+-translocating ferredoxin:NAD+ oxidoreductase RnfA subunit